MTRLLIVALFTPGIAAAQEPSVYHRAGHVAWGFSVGVQRTAYADAPVQNTHELDLHLGGMWSDATALLFELQADDLDTTRPRALDQTLVMVAALAWLAPRWWVKGGVGSARVKNQVMTDHGLALKAALGFEVLSRPSFAIELEGHLSGGLYDGYRISAGTLGLGLGWY
jgi:hypothetical protein